MYLAKQQHKNYIDAIRSLVPSTIVLPAVPEFPDCAFVEDCLVTIGRRAIVTRLGHPSRHGEVDSILKALQEWDQTNGSRMHITDMRLVSGDHATCDGGDVLYTNRQLFIGLSDRTNTEGAHIVQSVLNGEGCSEKTSDDPTSCFETVIVPRIFPPVSGQNEQFLHLKSVVTCLDESTLVAPTGRIGDQILAAMRAVELDYTAYRLPDILACNVVSCNGTLICQATACSASRKVLEQAAVDRNLEIVFVDTSELAKKDAALTCCSVLLSA